jgi:hypothetical protein
VSVATLAWTIYTDLRSTTQSPSRDVLARTVRVRLDTANAIDAATRDRIVVVVDVDVYPLRTELTRRLAITRPPSHAP